MAKTALAASVNLYQRLRNSLPQIRVRSTPQLHIWTFLCAVTLCGLVFGGIVAGQMKTGDQLVLTSAVRHLLQAIQLNHLAPSGELWWQRITSDAQLLALIWLFGVSVIGLPFVVVAIFLRAFSAGFAIGFTVLQFGWKGLILATFTIFLHQVVAMFVFMCAGVLAIRFSARILRQKMPLNRLSVQFVKYTGLFVVCLGGLMVAACIQAYLAPPILTHMLVS